MHTGMRLRIAHCSMIYKKALRLSGKAQRQSTIGMIIDLHVFKLTITRQPRDIFSGQMVNLLSNDVGRFDGAVDWIHYLWIGPIQMIIVMFILWKIVGPECCAGTVLCVALIPFQGKLRLHEDNFNY